MILLGAVIVTPDLSKTFLGKLYPVSDNWIPEALAVSGYTREETMRFDPPQEVMEAFEAWLEEFSIGRPYFIADNNGFDFAFVNWYFHHFVGHNPFGYSSTNLGSLYKGLVKDSFKNFKHLRKTKHSHNPVDDAMGNAEALLKMREEFDLKIRLE